MPDLDRGRKPAAQATKAHVRSGRCIRTGWDCTLYPHPGTLGAHTSAHTVSPTSDSATAQLTSQTWVALPACAIPRCKASSRPRRLATADQKTTEGSQDNQHQGQVDESAWAGHAYHAHPSLQKCTMVTTHDGVLNEHSHVASCSCSTTPAQVVGAHLLRHAHSLVLYTKIPCKHDMLVLTATASVQMLS